MAEHDGQQKQLAELAAPGRSSSAAAEDVPRLKSRCAVLAVALGAVRCMDCGEDCEDDYQEYGPKVKCKACHSSYRPDVLMLQSCESSTLMARSILQ